MQSDNRKVGVSMIGRIGSFAAAVGTCVLLLGCGTDSSAPPAPSQVSQTGPEYRLGSGDRVRVTVFGQQDLSGEYRVDGTGLMAFPLVGQVPAGGKTAAEVQTELVQGLSPKYLKNPNISIEVLSYRPFYVVGEVKTPGSYSYVNGMTVLNAVALAGGFTYRAREDQFFIVRNTGGGKSKMSAAVDTPVQPGDVITVRERYF
jgi:protein involved in polysaccharide export with SLBB domain